MINELPTPGEFFSGKLPEDNVTPEQFDQAVEIATQFSNLDISSVKDNEDFARVTRDLGLSISRLVLSCGQVQITDFSFEDPRIVAKGDALIESGDVSLGNEVKKDAEAHLSSKTMIIRTKEDDDSSTIVSFNGSDEFISIFNDSFEDDDQFHNYNARLPIVLEVDKVKDYSSVFAVDFRGHPTMSFYPNKKGSDINTIHKYLEIAQTLVSNILVHLKKKRFID
jgi:hypothetical protein